MSEEDREREERDASFRRLLEERRDEKRRAQQCQMRTSEDAPVASGSMKLPVMPPRLEPKVPTPGEGNIGFSGTFVGQTDALRGRVSAQVPRPSGEIKLEEADLGTEAAPGDKVVKAEVEPAAVVTDTPADHELVAVPSPQPSPLEGGGESGRYIWTEEDKARVQAERAAQEAVPQAVPHPELSAEAQEEAAVHMDAAIAHLNEVADQMVEPQKPVLEVVAPVADVVLPPSPAPPIEGGESAPSPLVGEGQGEGSKPPKIGKQVILLGPLPPAEKPAEPTVMVASTADGGQPVEMPVQYHEARLAALEREEQEAKMRKARELEEKEHAGITKRAAASRAISEREEAERQAKREVEETARAKHAQNQAKEQAAYQQALEGSLEDMLTSEQTMAALALARRDHKDGKAFRSAAMLRLGSQRNGLWVIVLLLLAILMMQFATFSRMGSIVSDANQVKSALQQELTTLRDEIVNLGARLPTGWKMECRLARLVKDGEETYVYHGCFPVPEGMENPPNPGPAPHGEAEVSE